MTFVPWVSAKRCTSGPQPGATALMKWIIEDFGGGSMNWGIFNCRTVRGGSTTSLHGEGRALDVGFALGDPDGDELRKMLQDNAGRLGLQAIIYERRIYSALSPEGRYYGGVAPHYDHLHIELGWEAANKLTVATVAAILDEGLPRHFRGTRSLLVGSEGTDVKWVQRHLNRHHKAGLTLDGQYGPATAKAVKVFEEKRQAAYPRMKADGNVGGITWSAMGVDPKFRKAHR